MNKTIFKLLTIAGLVFFTQGAFAEVKLRVSSIKSISIENTTLNYSYSTGGGCQTHTGKVEVEILSQAQASGMMAYTAKINIYDVSPAADFCEAIIYVEDSVDLKALITKAAADAGVNTNQIEVILPTLSYNLF